MAHLFSDIHVIQVDSVEKEGLATQGFHNLSMVKVLIHEIPYMSEHLKNRNMGLHYMAFNLELFFKQHTQTRYCITVYALVICHKYLRKENLILTETIANVLNKLSFY